MVSTINDSVITVNESLKPNPVKTLKLCFCCQILFRQVTIVATVIAIWLMITNEETEDIFGIQADARYSYSPAFKFFVLANLIAFGFSTLSLLSAVIMRKKAVHPKGYFCLFVVDMLTTLLLMAGCASATAIGYLGKYGNEHTGWMAICGDFPKFCNRGTLSMLASYLGMILYLIVTIVSANLSRKSQTELGKIMEM